ncbi:MAG: phage tail protein [Planctomycetes bacterium]|nr:phage tail protein [Planctomycetota bacterium]
MDNILDVLTADRDQETQRSRIYGVVVGIVTDNKDPEKQGRVKVRFPWLVDKDTSWWARVATLMAGKGRGSWFLPEIDDEVLVAFDHGDINHPYVIGALWNGKDVPPQANDIVSGFAGNPHSYKTKGKDFNEDGKDDVRFIRSRSGHLVILDDTSGTERIGVVDKTGKHRIEVLTDKKKVVITSEDGDIEMYAPKGKVYIECEVLQTKSTKDTQLEAGGKLDMTSKMDMTVKTDQNMKTESKMNMNVKAGMNLEMKAGPQMTAKAAMTTLEASALMTVKGMPVKIN